MSNAAFQRDVAKAQKQLGDMDKRIKVALTAASKAGAEILRDEAKARAPVDTGNLRGSIDIRPGKNKTATSAEYVVFAGAWYAHFVEYGLRKRPKYPKQAFMRPAFDASQGRIAAVASKVILDADGI